MFSNIEKGQVSRKIIDMGVRESSGFNCCCAFYVNRHQERSIFFIPNIDMNFR